jgi:hypothetical protein
MYDYLYDVKTRKWQCSGLHSYGPVTQRNKGGRNVRPVIYLSACMDFGWFDVQDGL